MRNDAYPTPGNTNAQRPAPELDISGYLPARGPAPKPAPAASNPAGALAAALDRLDRVIEAETHALEANAPIDLAETNRQKSQGLLEITRLSRGLPPGGDPAVTARLGALRERLAENQRLLGFHLAAVREVSDLMVGVLNEAESDGTYDPRRMRRDGRT